MQFGDSKFGQSRFGTTALAGVGHVTMSSSSSASVSGLAASVEGLNELRATSAGQVSGASYDAVGDSEMVIETAGGATSISTGTDRAAIELSIASESLVTDASLTTGARFPGLVDTISPPRDISERERIESYLKRPFQKDYPAAMSGGTREPGEFAALMDLFGEFAQRLVTERHKVFTSRFVDLAHGQSLDYIGDLLLLPRRTGETDAHYRIRLKSYARALTGNATIDEIRSTLALLLECDVNDIKLTEPANTIARFDMRIDQTILDEAKVSVSDVVDLVTMFRAGGVKVTLSVTGSFTHRSLEDIQSGTDLGEKGYNEAYYSGRIV